MPRVQLKYSCFAYEIGMRDGLRGGAWEAQGAPKPRIDCGCMSWAYTYTSDASASVQEQRWPDHKLSMGCTLLSDAQFDLFGSYSLPFQWLDPPPGGQSAVLASALTMQHAL